MTKEVDVVTLEDNIDYIILDTIDNYVFLAQENNIREVSVKKIEIEDNEEYYAEIETEEELSKALLEFAKKHKDLLDDHSVLTV